jgi:hypothetical protein
VTKPLTLDSLCHWESGERLRSVDKTGRVRGYSQSKKTQEMSRSLQTSMEASENSVCINGPFPSS